MSDSRYRVYHFACAIDSRLGGVPQAVCLINETLSTSGIENSVFSYGNSKHSKKRSSSLVERYSNSGSNIKMDTGLISNQYGLGISNFPRVLFRAEQVDLVILHQVYNLSTILGYVVSRIKRVPFVVMPHGSLAAQIEKKSSLIKYFARMFILNRIFNNSYAFVFTSSNELEQFQDKDGHKSITIPFVVKNTQQRESSHYNAASNFVIFVGRFGAEKNLVCLVESWKQVVTFHPSLKLKLIGYRSIDEYNSLIKVIRRLELSNSISLHPWQSIEEITVTFSDAKLFVLPSLTENFGLIAAEAMAFGIPCVVTPNVPLSGLIRKFSAGVVTTGTSSGELSSGLIEILTRDLEEISKHSKELIREEFSEIKTIKLWVSLLQECRAVRG